jgi:hypothetical protein
MSRLTPTALCTQAVRDGLQWSGVIEERSRLLPASRTRRSALQPAAGHAGSAVDELIADRRARAAREEAEA